MVVVPKRDIEVVLKFLVANFLKVLQVLQVLKVLQKLQVLQLHTFNDFKIIFFLHKLLLDKET